MNFGDTYSYNRNSHPFYVNSADIPDSCDITGSKQKRRKKAVTVESDVLGRSREVRVEGK